MLSLEQIRNEPDAVRAALVRRAEDDDCLDEILALDTERRVAITDGDNLRSRRNQVSREIGQARAQGQQPPDDVVAEMRNVGQQISDLEETVRTLDVRINGLLMELPNLPDATTLDGLDESANRVLRHWGELPQFDFAPQPHWDLAEQLGVIDFQRGVKLSGSRFYTLNGRGARLERAIISWMLDLHSEEHGYTEMALPILVRREIMEALATCPASPTTCTTMKKMTVADSNCGSAGNEPAPRRNMSADELPLYYVAHTPCFRREKAAAGRDTRGIKRVHQFNKVEMYKFGRAGNLL